MLASDFLLEQRQWTWATNTLTTSATATSALAVASAAHAAAYCLRSWKEDFAATATTVVQAHHADGLRLAAIAKDELNLKL